MKRNFLDKTSCIIISILSSILLISIIIISCSDKSKQLFAPENDFGKQINSGTNISQENNTSSPNNSNAFLAPFIDMVSWVDTANRYSVNGVPNLGLIYDEIGCEYFNLGFIRPDDNKPLDENGNIRWGWGGYYKLSEKGNDGYQYEGIKKSISNLRARGGDVIVSVGGQLGRAPWVVSQDVTKLEKMYLEIIDAYKLTRIDLDIEESNQGFEQNVANAKAIKRVQDKTGIEVVLTIPIMPYGYTITQKNLLRAYIGNGVNIKLINNMTMCYGAEVNPGEDFAKASVRALENSSKQVQTIYNEFGTYLTQDKVYKMLGATVDIGYENEYNPIFTPAMTKEVAEFAKSVNLGMFSYWSVNRDAKFQPNIGVNQIYEFYEASKAYL